MFRPDPDSNTKKNTDSTIIPDQNKLPCLSYGTYVRWYIRNMCSGKEQSLLFDMFKAFNHIKSNNKQYFLSKRPIFLQACATCSELHIYHDFRALIEKHTLIIQLDVWLPI